MATAADEPDYGHDIFGLNEDNEVEAGKGVIAEQGKYMVSANSHLATKDLSMAPSTFSWALS
ncbi:MAG: hypothetical protein IPO06_14320 [Leptospiraceae bacterium]|nr:hypothetical protein [Leptospiraceae bacterium]